MESEQVFFKASKDPKAFWTKAAKELDWFKPWKNSWNGTARGQSGLLAASSMLHIIASTAMSKG